MSSTLARHLASHNGIPNDIHCWLLLDTLNQQMQESKIITAFIHFPTPPPPPPPPLLPAPPAPAPPPAPPPPPPVPPAPPPPPPPPDHPSPVAMKHFDKRLSKCGQDFY